MKTLRLILIIVPSAIFFLGAILFAVGYFKPKDGGVRIETNPSSSVYLNSEFAGKTPLTKNLPGGSVDVKLIPDAADQGLVPFETKINVVPGIQTVIRREFGKSEDESSGDIISFEKDSQGTVSLVVVTTPDNAQVSIDGVPRGFAPYKTTTISPAAHQVSVKSSGFVDRIMTISTKEGYRLVLFVKLSKSLASSQATPTPTPASQSAKLVLILDTPTGYLRLRTEPGTKGEEIAQVSPGEKFPYLSTDDATGWFQIQYQEPKPGLPRGIVGWVSNQYAKIVDSSGEAMNATPTPSSTPSF